MDSKVSRKERFSYRFDNLMAKGTAALVGLLFLVTFIVVLLVAFVAFVATPEQINGSVGTSVWESLMRVLDAGNIAGDYGSGNWLYVVLMFLATICGLFVTSILIGIINTAFENKLAALRKGNSRVLEQGHTLIVGFNSHIYSVLSELIVANESEKKPVIVILSELDKEEMEDNIRANLPQTKNTKLICRSGDVSNFSDLKNVGILSAKSVIVLSDDDFSIIKTVLAATTLLEDGGRKDTYITTIVNSADNLPALKIAGQNRLVALYCKKTIARIIAQTCRQPGLSLVYQELFDFEGDEIYMEDAPSLVGLSFSQAVMCYENASVMGVLRGESCLINPPMDSLIESGDKLILIAADNGVAKPMDKHCAVDEAKFAPIANENSESPENILVLGYNDRTHDVLIELGSYLAPGSRVVLATQSVGDDVPKEEECRNYSLNVYGENIYDSAVLEQLLNSDDFKYIVVLSDNSDETADRDAHTLTLLLQLRDISQKRGKDYVIVSEMESVANQRLAACARVNDFVVGSNFVSLMMTQVAENYKLNSIFETLLTDEGSEIYIKSVSRYVKLGEPVAYSTAVASAERYNELAIGYKLKRDGGDEVRVNPPKSEIIAFNEGDRLIVLAED